MKFQKQHETHFPLGEFVCVNSKKLGTDPTFSWQIFSLTNRIAKICFSLCANKFALWKMGFTMVSSSDNICFGNLTSDINPTRASLLISSMIVLDQIVKIAYHFSK